MNSKLRFFGLLFTLLIAISALNAQTYTVGTGTIVNADNDYPAPYGNYFMGAKHQFLVLASELVAAGGGAGTINSIAFDVARVEGSPLSNFTIKIGTTSSTSLTAYQTGLTTVFTGTFTEVSGWNTHAFTSGFAWDGSSNIVIETCFNNNSYTENAGVRQTATSFNSTIVWADDVPTGLCATTIAFPITQRPNIRFNITPAGPCTNPPTAGTATSSVSTACPTAPIILGISGATTGSGQTYLWQSSADNINWTDISGATTSIYQHTQTSATYYRVIVTCGTSDTSTVVFVDSKLFYECYCESEAFNNDDTEITNFTLNTINSSSAPTCRTYTDFTSRQTQLQAGVSYPISVTQGTCGGFYGAYGKVYIDFNQNGVFDSNEVVFSFGPTTSLGAKTGNIHIPSNAPIGVTGLRVILSEDEITSSCGYYYYGETEDYRVEIITSAPCVDPPTAGNVTSSVDSVCPNTVFPLQLSGASSGTGQTYQWQKSYDNQNWTNIPGATSKIYTDTFTAPVWYRVNVTCGSTVTSGALKINQKIITQCYCTSAAAEHDDTEIVRVRLNTIDNSSAATCRAYTDFTNISTHLTPAQTYPIIVNQGTCDGFFAAYLRVYIDLNQDGTFDDATELLFSHGPTTGLGPISGNITIPANAALGATRMRIILSEDAPAPACGFYYYGETEDYTVIISTSTPCTDPPVAGNATSSVNSACPGEEFTLNITGNSSGAGQTYKWQRSTDNVNWADVTTENSSSNYNATMTASAWYRAIVTCGASSTTTSVYVSQKPVTQCYCTSEAVSDMSSEIGNVTLLHLNNTTDGDCGQYSDFTADSIRVVRGMTYPISITHSTCDRFAPAYINVYIDFNQDGTFNESTEKVFSFGPTTSNGAITGNIQIPLTALQGNARMRIVLSEEQGTTACGTYMYGETEDYLLHIMDGMSVGKYVSDFQLNLYPNPANSIVQLEILSSNHANYTARIYDLLGRNLMEKQGFVAGKENLYFNVNNLAAGHYLVKVNVNGSVVNRKLVITN